MFDVKGMDPISSHNAGLFKNGVHMTECTGFEINSTIETKESRVIGQQATKPRVRAVKHGGKIKFYKRNRWLYEYVLAAQNNQYVEPFDLQGVVDDPGSDFGREVGTEIVTVKNCTLTGALPVMSSDTSCDDVEYSVDFIGEKME